MRLIATSRSLTGTLKRQSLTNSMKKVRTPLSTLVAICLAACSTVPERAIIDEGSVEEGPEYEPPVKLKYLDKLNLKPMPVKAFTVSSRCSRKDESGTKTRLNLKVKDSKVANFNAAIDIPKRGNCQFDLRDFVQTATLPQVILTHRTTPDCQVRMWAQERQITIAYNTCAQACSGDSFDYLWPTLVDGRSGRCD